MASAKKTRPTSRDSKLVRALKAAKPKFQPGKGSWLPTETLVFGTGRVQWYREERYTVIQTKSALLRVDWAGRYLPPSVYVGKNINFVGKLKTFNAGKIFWVKDALPVQGNYREMAKLITAYLYQFADDPRDWAEQEWLDRLALKDVT